MDALITKACLKIARNAMWLALPAKCLGMAAFP